MTPFEKIIEANGASLLIFEHGLGDFINFLPVFKELCEQTGKRIHIAASPKRQFKYIYKDIIEIEDFSVLKRRFAYIYKVIYPDPKDTSIPIEMSEESSKPYICAYYELGMDEFVWKPFHLKNDHNKRSKRIGVHLFGHTGMDKKFCPMNVAIDVWNEIKEAGYDPYECHMTPKFAEEYPDYIKEDYFGCIDSTCSLRFASPDLRLLIKEISMCKYFIGIDSGPIYLASALIGTDNIIGLENQKKHNNFLPKHIITVPVNNYKTGTIYHQLKLKEEWS